MNDDQFVNWRNKHPVKAIYNSQRSHKVPLGSFYMKPAHNTSLSITISQC